MGIRKTIYQICNIRSKYELFNQLFNQSFNQSQCKWIERSKEEKKKKINSSSSSYARRDCIDSGLRRIISIIINNHHNHQSINIISTRRARAHQRPTLGYMEKGINIMRSLLLWARFPGMWTFFAHSNNSPQDIHQLHKAEFVAIQVEGVNWAFILPRRQIHTHLAQRLH